MYETDIAYSNSEIEMAGRRTSVQRIKNKIAIQLLNSWLEDDSGYDEEIWLKAKNAIEENRLSQRKKFND